MSKSGTTQSAILKRRNRNGQIARLNAVLRRWALPLLGLALAVGVVAWAWHSGMPGRVGTGAVNKFYAATGRAGFTVQAILVEGRVNADAGQLRDIIGMKRGDPIFAFHPHRTMDALDQMSWIKAAKVERRLPGTIYVRLTERTPVALWQSKGKLKLVDGDGVVLTDHDLDTFRDLLIIVGPDAPRHIGELASLLDLDPDLKGRVEAAMYVSDRRWDMKLKNGITVRLPETDPGIALARLSKAQKDDRIMDKNLTVIDLRDSDRIIVATKPGEAQDYEAQAGKDHSI